AGRRGLRLRLPGVTLPPPARHRLITAVGQHGGVSPETALATPLPSFPGQLGRPRQILLKALLRTFGNLLEIEGAERLARAPQPALFALTHSNAAEALLVPAALPQPRGRPVHFLADWMYLEIPLLGPFLRLGEPIPVYRKRARFGFGER